ncbi:Putative addiction module component CHP02574 family protein [Caldithrix abyssi DSM 13497]|uniref:Addiction module component n=1 Tax=Caldithrix abyssi DSM 13497 TaxID=880073 RepID=H1XQU8_CALAY|nr:addiction module protein [Caldithrix abyssi]APF18360.1 Putative addiction module component [Caldithrix abyssi DSM 13497]EHO42371.1 Putative addiction module component CHP02574 family protein [Caldithrix abyssi DSM 13497]
MEIILENMTIEEKLKLMEEIWSDLIKYEKQIPSSLWHKAVLEEREKKIKDGKEAILNWNEAKDKIRKYI